MNVFDYLVSTDEEENIDGTMDATKPLPWDREKCVEHLQYYSNPVNYSGCEPEIVTDGEGTKNVRVRFRDHWHLQRVNVDEVQDWQKRNPMRSLKECPLVETEKPQPPHSKTWPSASQASTGSTEARPGQARRNRQKSSQQEREYTYIHDYRNAFHHQLVASQCYYNNY